MKRSCLWIAVLCLLCSDSNAQQQGKIPPQQPQQNPPAAAGEDPCKKPLDQAKIDEAIKKGCEFLLNALTDIPPQLNAGQKLPANQKPRKGNPAQDTHSITAELVLLTLIHGGAFKEKDERCQQLLEYVLNWEPRHTYRAALKAMALKELDKKKYIEFIAQAGQYLVNSQSSDGRWGYSGQAAAAGIDTNAAKPKIRTGAATGDKTGTSLQLKKGTTASSGGDNSNTQYAALGLRAVHDAGIEIPKETLQLARQWWEKGQFQNGGWDYSSVGGGLGKTEVQQAPPPTTRRGRRAGTPHRGNPTNAMTAGGVSSLSIYLYLMGEAKKKEDFAKNPAIAAGIKWLSDDFENIWKAAPDKATYWANLYLAYSVERAGILGEFKKLGEHDWYKEGAHALLKSQGADGSWNQYGNIGGTCFAILFLKKATEPLIDTGEKFIDNTPAPEKPVDSGEQKKEEDKKE